MTRARAETGYQTAASQQGRTKMANRQKEQAQKELNQQEPEKADGGVAVLFGLDEPDKDEHSGNNGCGWQ